MNKILLLYDQPWNQRSKCEKNVFRVKTWNDVIEKINTLNEVHAFKKINM